MLGRAGSSSPHKVLEELVTLEAVVPLEKVRSCPDCSAVFTTKDELNAHALTHDEVFKFFDLAMGMMMYDAAVQVEQVDIFECMRCTRGFTERTDYELHKLTHLKESFSKEDQIKPFGCKYCVFSFAEASILERHMLTHRPLPYICFCGFGYRYAKTLQIHLKQAHKVQFQEPTGLTNSVFDSLVNEWQSYYCNTNEPARVTVEMTNEGDNSEPVNGNGQIKVEKAGCSSCTNTHWRNTNGLSHLRVELENRLRGLIDTNKCEDCGAQVVQTPTLKVYKCYLCPKAFIGYHSVEKHEQEHKEKEKLDCVLSEVSETMDDWF